MTQKTHTKTKTKTKKERAHQNAKLDAQRVKNVRLSYFHLTQKTHTQTKTKTKTKKRQLTRMPSLRE